MGNVSSKLPLGRAAEPSSGTKTQPSCTPFSGRETGPRFSEGDQRSPWPNQLQRTSCKARSQPQKARIPEQAQGSVGAVLCTHKPKVKPSKRSALPACQGSEGSSLWRGAGQWEDETQPLRPAGVSGVLLAMLCTKGRALNWSFGFLKLLGTSSCSSPHSLLLPFPAPRSSARPACPYPRPEALQSPGAASVSGPSGRSVPLGLSVSPADPSGLPALHHPPSSGQPRKGAWARSLLGATGVSDLGSTTGTPKHPEMPCLETPPLGCLAVPWEGNH